MAGLIGETSIKRGEIWTADLRPGKGYEIAKIRPVLIISSDIVNSISPMVTVLPISSQLPPVLGSDKIHLSKKQTGLTKESAVLISHIRSIDKSRITKKVGKIPKGKLAEIEEAVRLTLDLNNSESI